MNYRLVLACALIATCATTFATAAVSPPIDQIAIHLHADALISHQHVVLGDIARIHSSDDKLQKSLEQLPIGKSPRVSSVSRVRREELVALVARRFSVPEAQLVWTGSESVALRSASHLISINLLVDIAKESLQKQFGQRYPTLVLNAVSLPPDLELPLGVVSMQARPVNSSRLHARTPVWVDVKVDGAVYRSAVIALQVSAMEQVYVARQTMPRGSLVSAAAFDLRVEDVAMLAEPPVAVGSQPPARRLKRALAQGQVLSEPWLTDKEMVLSGDRVHLVVATSSVQIEVMAQAQSDAMVGEVLKVKIESNGEVVAGRLISQDVVKMDGRL